MKKNITCLLLITIIISIFCLSLNFCSSQTINVKDYIKDKFPSIFGFYLSSLENLDSYEKKFIDLLRKLPIEEQEYYAKEVYKNGFSLELLNNVKEGETIQVPASKSALPSTPKQKEELTENLPSLIKRIKPSVVIVFAYDNKGEFLKLGSGFFISQNGDIITNYHVLQGANSAEIKTSDGKTYPLTYIIAKDEQNDIIRLSADIPSKYVLPLSLSETIPEIGEKIIVYGSPLGLENTVSDGIVSSVREIYGYGKIVQITAPISPGSSGSPVLNMNGEVIGVASFQMIEGQNLNFAIPSEKIAILNLAKEKKISLSEKKEIGKDIPKYKPTKILSANITITDWDQESYGLLGRSDYVYVYYAVENTGEADIDYYKIYFTVTCKKGKEFYEWTNGMSVGTGHKSSGKTMIDVAGNKVISVEITDWELTSY
jgi:S1-C subfamily serine protease